MERSYVELKSTERGEPRFVPHSLELTEAEHRIGGMSICTVAALQSARESGEALSAAHSQAPATEADSSPWQPGDVEDIVSELV